MSWLSAGISALGSIGGALLGKSSSDKANRIMADSMRHGIKWRTWDANEAGVHPLYALGAPTFNPNPSVWDPSAAFANAGQDISRAIDARRTEAERLRNASNAEIGLAVQRERDNELYGLSVERAQLENDLLRSQIVRNAQQSPPPSPSPAGRRVAPGTVDEIAPVVEQHSRHNPGRSPGAITGFQHQHTGDGGLRVVPSEQAKQRMDDDITQQVAWQMAYGLGNVRQFGGGEIAPPNTEEYPLPDGMSWSWDWDRQAYYPRDRATGQWVRPGARPGQGRPRQRRPQRTPNLGRLQRRN